MVDRFPKDTAQQRTYRAFELLLAGEDDSIDLAQAALLIASIEYPELDVAHYLTQLDTLACRVRMLLGLPAPEILPALPAEIDPLSVIKTMNTVLIAEEHFHGNQNDYYNPQNSFLNKVLDERTGIPIILSLIYMEVGKRVGIQIDGIGFPAHFMVRYRFAQSSIYSDPYADGLLLNENDCIEHIRRILQRKIKFYPQYFLPVSRRQMLVRILNNLKKIYLEQEDYARALVICDLILLHLPQNTLELRDRGSIHLQLKHYARALQDLIAYTELAPHAEDCDEMREHIKTIHRIIAMLN